MEEKTFKAVLYRFEIILSSFFLFLLLSITEAFTSSYMLGNEIGLLLLSSTMLWVIIKMAPEQGYLWTISRILAALGLLTFPVLTVGSQFIRALDNELGVFIVWSALMFSAWIALVIVCRAKTWGEDQARTTFGEDIGDGFEGLSTRLGGKLLWVGTALVAFIVSVTLLSTIATHPIEELLQPVAESTDPVPVLGYLLPVPPTLFISLSILVDER